MDSGEFFISHTSTSFHQKYFILVRFDITISINIPVCLRFTNPTTFITILFLILMLKEIVHVHSVGAHIKKVYLSLWKFNEWPQITISRNSLSVPIHKKENSQNSYPKTPNNRLGVSPFHPRIKYNVEHLDNIKLENLI